MKLRYTPTSPYVRKVTVTAHERGLDGRIERIPTDVWDPNSDIGRDNPLGKVPALTTDDGLVLYDSPVICEYLDSVGDGPRLFPATGVERWIALRRAALGDGILDAGVARLLEGRREEALRSATWVARQAGKVAAGLDALEAEAGDLDAPLTIGHIAIAAALGFLDFRFAAEDWRPTRPALARWYETFAARPSMQATVPQEPPPAG
jgi:glutathione S-transferase